MEAKKPRSPRTPLVASAECVDAQSSRVIRAQTSDVSLSGCYLEMPEPLPIRSALTLKLTYNGSSLSLFADVVRSEKGKGMGVKFRGVEPAQLAALKSWLFAADRPDW